MSFIPLLTAGLAAFAPLASAYTTPKGDPTGNAIYEPGLNSVVPVGKPFSITWEPTTKGEVSLVLLHGCPKNCVAIDTIVEKIENTGSYDWTPASTLASGKTGYGIELIVEGTGQYQYSTQFGISNPNLSEDSYSASAAASDSATASTASATTTVSVNIKAPLSSASASASSVASSASAAISSASAAVSSVSASLSSQMSSASSAVSSSASAAMTSASSANSSASKHASSAASSMSTATRSASKSAASASKSASSSASPAAQTGAAGKVGAGFGGAVFAVGVVALVL